MQNAFEQHKHLHSTRNSVSVRRSSVGTITVHHFAMRSHSFSSTHRIQKIYFIFTILFQALPFSMFVFIIIFISIIIVIFLSLHSTESIWVGFMFGEALPRSPQTRLMVRQNENSSKCFVSIFLSTISNAKLRNFISNWRKHHLVLMVSVRFNSPHSTWMCLIWTTI